MCWTCIFTHTNALAAAFLQVAEVQSLIGFFDLDPHRVYDLLLDAFIRQPFNTAYLGMLSLFSPSALVHILGFKFQKYHASSGDTDAGPSLRNMYIVAAQIIKVRMQTAAVQDVLVGPGSLVTNLFIHSCACSPATSVWRRS